MRKRSKDDGNIQTIAVIIITIAILALLGFIFWKSYSQTAVTKNVTLSESDKAKAVEFANKFFTSYDDIIKNSAANIADTSKPYSTEAAINTLISNNASDKFITNYFKTHLTNTLATSDPILCVQNTSETGPSATNASISDDYINMDIVYFNKVTVLAKVIKDSDSYKIDSLSCNY